MCGVPMPPAIRGETAAERHPAGASRDQRGAVGADRAHRLGVEQGGPQMLLGTRALDEVGARGHRPVQRDQAEPHRERLVQRGDVAEPDEHLGPRRPHRLPVEGVGHALCAVAAARADDRVDGRVAPGALQIGGTVGVGAGQVPQLAVPVEDVRGGHGVEAPAAQHVEPGREPLLGNGSAGGDHGHSGAGGEAGRPPQRGQGAHGFSSRTGMPGVFSPNTCAYRDSSASRARTMVSARRKPWPSPSKVR
ncbi:hypothetical protein RKD39_001174 [Streptomyces albogriseolus]